MKFGQLPTLQVVVRKGNMISLEKKAPLRSIVLARRASDIDNRRIDALLSCLRDGFAKAPSPA